MRINSNKCTYNKLTTNSKTHKFFVITLKFQNSNIITAFRKIQNFTKTQTGFAHYFLCVRRLCEFFFYFVMLCFCVFRTPHFRAHTHSAHQNDAQTWSTHASKIVLKLDLHWCQVLKFLESGGNVRILNFHARN